MSKRAMAVITEDELPDMLTLDPLWNLEVLSRCMINITNSDDCFIVSEGAVILSLGEASTLPDSGLVQIPVDAKSESYIYLGNTENDCLPSNPNVYRCLISLINNNIEAYRILLSASTDKLTGVLNRKYLDISIDKSFDSAKRLDAPLSVVICDIDFFKHVNDTYGHMVGDDVLRETSRVIRESIRHNTTRRRSVSSGDDLGYNSEDEIIHYEGEEIGRYGGEEFILLLKNADAAVAYRVAERIRLNVQNAKLLGDKRDITLSLGVATFPTHANTRKTLVEKADKALYMAKKSGRNMVTVWDETFDDEVVSKNIVRDIISGDTVKDSAKMTAIFEILEVSRQGLSLSDKLDKAFSIILDTAGAKNIALFIFDGDNAVKTYEASGKKHTIEYNHEIVEAVAKTQVPVFTVDWDNETPDESGMADWQSLAAVPVIKDGLLKGVLYLSVSVKEKEFTGDEAGFICNAGMLLATYL